MCNLKILMLCICVFSFSERAAAVLPFTVFPFRVNPDKAEFDDIIFSLFDIRTSPHSLTDEPLCGLLDCFCQNRMSSSSRIHRAVY